MSGIADQINERLNLADGILAKLNSYVEARDSIIDDVL